MRILYSRHFIADLDGIADYIRLDNPTRAISFVEELKMVCREIIAVHPRIGRRRSGLGVDRRSFQTHGRVIYYPAFSIGLPPVSLKQPKATFPAISVSGPRVVLRAGRIARPNRPIRPFKASLDAFSDTPFLSPALDLADLGGFLVMCTLLRQADRAAR